MGGEEFCNSVCFSQEFDIKAFEIEGIVVHRNCANITRIIKGEAATGRGSLLIHNFPPVYIQNSLRIEVPEETEILEVSQRKTSLAHTNDELQQLEEKIKAMKTEKQKKLIQVKHLEKRIDILHTFMETVQAVPKHLSLQSSIDISTEGQLQKLQEATNTSFDEVAGIKADIAALQKTVNELDESIEEAKNQLNIKSASHLRPHEVEITVMHQKQQEVQVKISYLVSSVSWEPSYDMRIFSKSKEMELSYHGVICQDTGSDWERTKITLTTAHPVLGMTPPVLPIAQLWGGEEEPELVSPRGDRKSSVDIPELEYWIQVSEKARRMTNDPRTSKVKRKPSQNKQSSISFTIPQRSTVLCGNVPCKLTVGILPLHGEFRYTTTPRVLEKAFLRVIATNSSVYNHPMLQGPCNIFYDHTFISKTEIKEINTGEQFTLFVGADDSLIVNYIKTQGEFEVSGFINKVSTQHCKFLTRVENTKSYDITVKIVDQYPLSNDEKVKIKLSKPDVKSPNVSIYTNNRIEYSCNVPANGVVEFPIHYSIEFPSDKILCESGPTSTDNTFGFSGMTTFP